MSNTKKNAAIIGFGGMGSWHGRYLVKSDCVNLVGVYDILGPDGIRKDRKEFLDENGIRFYESLDEVLDDKNIDFVVVATPNDSHKPIALKAMAAGKHVVTEKPVVLNSAELQELIEASKKYNVIFTTHQNRRWDADYLMMKDIYRSGELGNVFNIESRVQGSRGIPGDWRGKPEHGGGMILDWGVHLIDQIVGIIDDKKLLSVYCKCDHITNKQVDDGFKLDMYFEDDVVARVEVGTNHFISIGRFFMVGTAGSAIIKDWHDDCHKIICTEWKEENVTPVVTAAGLTKTMAPRDAKTTEERTVPRYTSDVHDFYRNLVKAIDGEEEQLITHDQLRRSMMIMEAAFESDELGRPVEVEDILAPRKN